ncbi:hypothetical protein R3P38DRAFT_2799982 [Favolaschia claudopus]|uniref:Uncharacterized protein n=1 Tax=Favolaschia claudopus TaxID=2862362 RepID=A0AAV9ZYR0_9AGAR
MRLRAQDVLSKFFHPNHRSLAQLLVTWRTELPPHRGTAERKPTTRTKTPRTTHPPPPPALWSLRALRSRQQPHRKKTGIIGSLRGAFSTKSPPRKSTNDSTDPRPVTPTTRNPPGDTTPTPTPSKTPKTATRTYGHVPATAFESADTDMQMEDDVQQGLQWGDQQYDNQGYSFDNTSEHDRASLVSERTTPDDKFRGQQLTELADQVNISLKDAAAAFRISETNYQAHPTISQNTRELAEDVYRLTHGGDTWMERMVQSAACWSTFKSWKTASTTVSTV